jgi:hypothetical protein
MVITPFHDIARHVRHRANRYPSLVAGTIHTAQGKQADIVIVVLGSDPQRHFNVLAHRLPSSPR